MSVCVIKSAADERHEACLAAIRRVIDAHQDIRFRTVVIYAVDEEGASGVAGAWADRAQTIGALFSIATQMAQDDGGI